MYILHLALKTHSELPGLPVSQNRRLFSVTKRVHSTADGRHWLCRRPSSRSNCIRWPICASQLGSVRTIHLISSDVISADLVLSELHGSECVAKRPSSPWLRPIRPKQYDLLRCDWSQERRTGSAHSLTAGQFRWNEVSWVDVWGEMG